VTGKPVVEDLLSRAGITTDRVAEGAHGRMFGPIHPFSEDEWAIVNAWLDHIYADFTSKVADGRGMSEERVREVARGRVWTGADAVRNGLADSLGGLAEAAQAARRRGGLPVDAPLRAFPRVSPLDQLRPHESSEDRAAQAAGGLPSLVAELMPSLVPGLGPLAGAWGPAWQLAAQAGLSPYGPLMLPGFWRID